jgi:chorismate synthase
MVAVIEGFPKGVKIEEKLINQELKRRMSGFGRGKRMFIESDRAEILSGLRNKLTLGSPIAVLVKNKDSQIFPQKKDSLLPWFIPRPGHADLSGAIKYGEQDLRNIAERASARETVSRVCIGSICKQFLSRFKIKIASFTVSVGEVVSHLKPGSISQIISKVKKSKLNCIDKEGEKLMIKEIRRAEEEKDSLGGVVEIWIDGVCPGLGSFMHFDRRLDAKIAGYLMSIPAVKGVEIGLGFEYARKRGFSSHDAIFFSQGKGFYHKTNNSGGIEGGVSTGETIVLRIAMKPIATLRKPLESTHLLTKKKEKAIVVRSDTCAIVACGVIAESMCALVITEAFLEKFGGDSLTEIRANYRTYLSSLKEFVCKKK